MIFALIGLPSSQRQPLTSSITNNLRVLNPNHSVRASRRLCSSIPPSSATDPDLPEPSPVSGLLAWWKAQQAKSGALKAKLASLGLAAVFSYGLFDGISYTIAFAIAFLGYEAQTGLNPTQNVADIVKICILMWAGNNVTRPFRLAGAAALAPFMDKLMIKLQEKLKLPNKFAAFILMVSCVASICLGIVGTLFLSRWVVS